MKPARPPSSPIPGRLSLAAGALAAAALVGPSAAAAGTADVSSKVWGNGAGEIFTITYSAAPGETNVLDAQPLGSGAGFRLRDPVGIAPANRCMRVDPADVTTVVCEPRYYPGAPIEVTVDAKLGDGNDMATVFSGLLDGGPGADRLISRGFLQADSVFRGGPGDDTMVAEADESSFDEGARSNGADTIRADRGRASVSYGKRRRGVRLTLDGKRNDGERGERDSIIGVRELVGGRRADVLVGDASRNVLDGNQGADVLKGRGGDDNLEGGGAPGRRLGRGARARDVLVGGGGNDELKAGDGSSLLVGGPGNDRIEGRHGKDEIHARDGGADSVECGQDVDVAFLDALDFLGGPSDCERVRRRGAATAVPLAPASEPYYVDPLARALDVEVGCPADGPRRCRGTLLVEVAGRRVLDRRSVALRRGGSARFNAPLPDDVRAHLLGPNATLRATLTVSSRDRRGKRRRRSLAFTVAVEPSQANR